ncbi:DUF1275 domain-containing protein [Flavobacterium zepuense]|uniref:DUF1275 domain-containing protein n=1 Tax=Flavobacterium zepuense TaxID=2593302 RepID=A0A552V618_9FLAO|nr:YoaK family protein [Flavobacterium zepuense]TRW25892.1 DUF1275 domain-containing protein [Flavobacterium zepuense]
MYPPQNATSHPTKNIWYTTLLLTIIAGFCDTVTFVAADALFSAHVTGNFIVFAYQIVKGSDILAWVKLLTFPIFIVAVMVGGRIGATATNRYKLLLWEGVLLTVGGLTVLLLNYMYGYSNWIIYPVAMTVVFAMGLQNAFGKLYAKETYGPTTMMTGNVTQAALDLGNLFRTRFKDSVDIINFKTQLVTLSGFLAGCFLGAVSGNFFGLATIAVPGVALLICYLKNRNKTSA